MGRLVGRQHRRAMALALVAGLAVVAAVVATRPFGPPPPDRRNCDGVSAEAGGCDPDQPRFTATTCEGVGREFGVELNRRALPIINGPAVAYGGSRAVRLDDAILLVVGRANQYLRDQGMVADCEVEEFMTGAEPQFSPELRARAGEFIDDGDTVYSYEEWLDEVRDFLQVIDLEEDVPFLLPETSPPAASRMDNVRSGALTG